ncbi:hypothetical protein LMG28138_06100 [Pararobbsia alpina]|uniref:Uncharacterized protein n=1 Tax=Pararobbsia alpina TaxID=621374 RepID=A0A6S7DIP7_9BURK|nr:hypothetical protein LMG28138_06100 [Pararobbsia alpina]
MQMRIVGLAARLKIQADRSANMVSVAFAFKHIDPDQIETLRENSVIVGDIERWNRQESQLPRARIFGRKHQARTHRYLPFIGPKRTHVRVLVVGERMREPKAPERNRHALQRTAYLHYFLPIVARAGASTPPCEVSRLESSPALPPPFSICRKRLASALETTGAASPPPPLRASSLSRRNRPTSRATISRSLSDVIM